MGRRPHPSTLPTPVLQELHDYLGSFLADPGSRVLLLVCGGKFKACGRRLGHQVRRPQRQRPARIESSGTGGGSEA